MVEHVKPLDAIPPTIASVADYEAYARERMSPAAWAYLMGAAADGITALENTAAFNDIRLQQRVLADFKQASTQLELFGTRLDYPILLAPVAFQKLAHPEGELATALGASAMQAAMVVSTQASVRLEDIAAAASEPLWFQLYVQHDRDFTLELVRRAERSGYRALVLTVDAPVNGVRNQEQRAGFHFPTHVEAVNLHGLEPPVQKSLQAGGRGLFASGFLNQLPTWKDVEWLASSTSLPLLLKGVGNASDALKALDAGAAGIIVSNHGGRALDTLPATIRVLPEIAHAVKGRAPILLDGGIRRGTDVLKALALGASATLVGRPYIHGLAAAGAPGVAHVLHILRTELEMAMVLTGRPSLQDIDSTLIWSDRTSVQ